MYILGLDLGQVQDYTALCAVRRRSLPPSDEDGGRAGGADERTVYQVGHLERFSLGTKYTDVVRRVRAVQEQLGGRLIVDATGVGHAVVDMLQEEGLDPVGVWIHGGDKVSREKGTYRVPKRELAGALQVLVQNRRLEVQPSLKEAATLKAEMLRFKAKIHPQTGHDTYAADWREGEHDDLVLAVALACWYGEYGGRGTVTAASAPVTRASEGLKRSMERLGYGSRVRGVRRR